MKINKKLFTELLKSTIKEGETITKPAPVKTPGTTPTPGKNPNPLMPPKEAPKTIPKGKKLKEENIFDKVSQRYEKLKESADPSSSLLSLLEQIVSEDSIEQLRDKFVNTKKIDPEVFGRIVTATGGKGAYATWMVKRVEDKTIDTSDIDKYEDYLKFFNKFKREFPSPDINSYKDERSIRDFEQKAIELRERDIKHTGGDLSNASNLVPSKGIQELSEAGIKFIGTVDGYQCFLIPNSAKGNTKAWETYRKYLANCSGREQGAKIEICTMASQSHFDRYLTDYGGDYYVFFNLGDPKSPYQFHYESNQFMDKNDNALI